MPRGGDHAAGPVDPVAPVAPIEASTDPVGSVRRRMVGVSEDADVSGPAQSSDIVCVVDGGAGPRAREVESLERAGRDPRSALHHPELAGGYPEHALPVVSGKRRLGNIWIGPRRIEIPKIPQFSEQIIYRHCRGHAGNPKYRFLANNIRNARQVAASPRQHQR
jgi:hypothetical protein